MRHLELMDLYHMVDWLIKRDSLPNYDIYITICHIMFDPKINWEGITFFNSWKSKYNYKFNYSFGFQQRGR